MNNGKQGAYAFILFLVWPFLSAVTAFKNYRKSWAVNIFWLFCIFYGLTFAIGAESQGSDVVRYVAELERLHTQEMTIEKTIEYFKDSGEIDVLQTAIAVGLSRLTDSQPILTMVYGFIFGFFFSRNLWYVMDRLDGELLPITILLLVCLFLVKPIWSINGFRMWTAAHMFLYGLLPYLCEEKKKYLWISVLSMAVHFSMLVPVGLLIGYMLGGNRLNLYFGAFIFTTFFAELDISGFNSLMEAYAPEILQENTEAYRIEDLDDGDGGGNSLRWYAVWYDPALQYSIFALLAGLFVTGRDFLRKNRSWMNLYCFTLLSYSAVNLISALSSGGRFFTIVNFCALALLALYIQNVSTEKAMNRFVMGVTPALLLYVIVAIRIGLYSMSATSILGNPVVAYFMFGKYLSMNDFMKMIL